LREHLPQTRVIHLHGVDDTGRDHQSLRYTSREDLRAVLDVLIEARYTGVVTLEVFGEDDFFSSLDVLNQSLTAMNPRDS
jgi:hypothetical protein